MEEQVALAEGSSIVRRQKVAPKIIKHSKIEFKDGKFLVKGDKLPLEKKIPKDLANM